MSELRRAADLYKSGDKLEARKLIASICKAEPDNADAWYYAAMMSEQPEQRAKLLQRALAVDPFHERAEAALAKLGTSGQGTPVAHSTANQPKAARKTGSSVAMIAAVGVAGLVLLGLLGYLVFTLTRPQTAAPALLTATPLLLLNPSIEAQAGVTLTAEAQLKAASAAAAAVTPTTIPTITPTPAPYQITATAYLHLAQTADAELRLMGTAAAEANPVATVSN
ncbi:MAG: hypothetical protein SF123_25310 [Chloroflexota bacterium]|nr:hypothetical protein [Chloroflexota bacterium]